MEKKIHDNSCRILLFGSQITTGGAQRVLLDQAAWFFSKGYEVQALFFYDKDGLLDEWRKQYPFPIDTLSTFNRNGFFLSKLISIFSAYFKLVSRIKKFSPHIIESFTHDANLLAMSAGWLCRVPARIAAHHGQYESLSKKKITLHSWIANSQMASKLVCVSNLARNQALAEGVSPEKIAIIFNGVTPVQVDVEVRKEVRDELGLSDQQKMILSVGRLVPEKSQHIMVRVAEQRRNRQDIFFFLAGDGPLREELSGMISKANLDERFKLLGNRKDVGRLLNGADFFFLCSKTEGMPVSLMEAMSAGVPILASDLEGIRNLIPDDSYGLLVPVGNTEAFANALFSLLDDPDQTAKMADNAKRRALNSFSVDISCLQYQKMFDDFLKIR